MNGEIDYLNRINFRLFVLTKRSGKEFSVVVKKTVIIFNCDKSCHAVYLYQSSILYSSSQWINSIINYASSTKFVFLSIL